MSRAQRQVLACQFRRFGRTCPFSPYHRSGFSMPPLILDGRISRVRLGASEFGCIHCRAFPNGRKIKCTHTDGPHTGGCPDDSPEVP